VGAFARTKPVKAAAPIINQCLRVGIIRDFLIFYGELVEPLGRASRPTFTVTEATRGNANEQTRDRQTTKDKILFHSEMKIIQFAENNNSNNALKLILLI
jgi:hypothetical protein